MAQPRGFSVGYAGLGQRLEHQFRDRLVGLEIPVDAVGIAPPTHHLFGHSGFVINQREHRGVAPTR